MLSVPPAQPGSATRVPAVRPFSTRREVDTLPRGRTARAGDVRAARVGPPDPGRRYEGGDPMARGAARPAGRGERGRPGRWRCLLVAAGLVAGIPLASAGEMAWVKDEVRLNVRTGPGLEFRIVSGIGTGDPVEVLSRGDGWTEVRVAGQTGWIPAGYLQSEEPARLLVERATQEASQLRDRLDALGRDVERLRRENEQLSTRDVDQKAEVARLSSENLKLRAGARWPEWITGAGILGVGMVLGAILRSVNRRSTPRIRL